MACSNPIGAKGLAKLASSPQKDLGARLNINSESYIDDGKSQEESDKAISPPLYYLANFIRCVTWPFRKVASYFSKKTEKAAYKTTNSIMRNVAGIDEDRE